MGTILNEIVTAVLIFVAGMATGWGSLVVTGLLAMLNQRRAIRQIQESRKRK